MKIMGTIPKLKKTENLEEVIMYQFGRFEPPAPDDPIRKRASRKIRELSLFFCFFNHRSYYN